MTQLLCPFAAQCEIFQGKTTDLQLPLKIYQNVFCRRGAKGWNNCSLYIETKTTTK